MKLEPFALERWMTTWETEVEYDIAESGVYPMSTVELLNMLPESDRADAEETLLNLRLIYSEARGTRLLRSAIADTYEAVGPDDILVTTGAIEANFLLFSTLLQPGDHVVAIYPAYQQLYSTAEGLGCDVSRWEVRESEESGFYFDLADLHDLVRPDTRLIVINSPHNPTGAILSEEDLQTVYDLAESNGALVLSDEAYRWLELPGSNALPPPMRDRGPAGISVGTMSKPFGLPGLRIGWIAASQEIVQQCWHTRDYTTLSPGALNDYLATIAFACRAAIVARTQSIVAANLDVADAWFDKHKELVGWNRPRAGLLALIEYRAGHPSMNVADRLAAEFSVMLAPGSVFGYEGRLRMGIGQRPDLFAEGLERTAYCLESIADS